MLQAGSFTHDRGCRPASRASWRCRASSREIQRVVTIDDNYHRVRIGPTDDLDELNMLRSRLRAARSTSCASASLGD